MIWVVLLILVVACVTQSCVMQLMRRVDRLERLLLERDRPP